MILLSIIFKNSSKITTFYVRRKTILYKLKNKTKPTINQEYKITASVVWKQMENQGA